MNSIRDLDANKALVRRLFEEVIDGGDLSLADQLLRADYIQHNPSAGQGIEGFKAYFSDLERTKKRLRARSTMTIRHMLAEADHVFIYAETRMEGPVNLTFEAMDLFRIREGQIAEHWDVIQGRGLLSSLVLMVSG
jgi:predicted SnoaL-like aldol condensation-catalyzing enzyme